MVDFNAILQFSHNYCVAICAVLVPLNLLMTIRTLILIGMSRPVAQVWRSATLAIAFAGLMVLHVATWFVVGVVMIPTFVLLTLGSVCLGINLWAIGHPRSLERLLNGLWDHGQQAFRRMVRGVEAS